MRIITSLFFTLFIPIMGFCQQVLNDNNNIYTVNVNSVAKSTANGTQYTNYNNISNFKQKALEAEVIVAGVQTLFVRALTTVDNTLLQGKAVLSAPFIVKDILLYQNKADEYAASDPLLAVVSLKFSEELINRGAGLIVFINDKVLTQNASFLEDVAARDRTLQHILSELRMMRGIAYTEQQKMYFAKRYGILRTLNPFQSYINKDLALISDIKRKYKAFK